MTLKKLLFDLQVDDPVTLLLRTLIVVGGLILFTIVIQGLLVRIKSKTPLHSDIKVRLMFLWSVIISSLLFSVYWFFVIKYSGLHSFHWYEANFYWLFLPMVISFILIIILYASTFNKLKSPFKN